MVQCCADLEVLAQVNSCARGEVLRYRNYLMPKILPIKKKPLELVTMLAVCIVLVRGHDPTIQYLAREDSMTPPPRLTARF